MSDWFNRLYGKLTASPEPLKVSIRGVLYDVDKSQYKRGITEAIIYKDTDGFILWGTVQGSGRVFCELNLKRNLLPDYQIIDNPRFKGYSIVGSALSETEAFELIEGCDQDKCSIYQG